MFEIDFLPVGTSNGDAIAIRYGNETTGYNLHVVDGGYQDTGKTIIDHIEKHYGIGLRINHLVLSHADNDHAAGLIDVMKHFNVDHLWMNRPWLYAEEILDNFHGNYTKQGLVDSIREKHSYLVELENLAESKGTQIHEVFQGAQIGQFRVLAPTRARYIKLLPDLDKTPTSYAETAAFSVQTAKGLFEKVKNWVFESWDIETLSNKPEPTSASNETCIVQHAVLDGKTILLTADVGPDGLNEAADYAFGLGLTKAPKFVQVPHHGSRRNVSPAVLDRWLGKKMGLNEVYGVAYCSVGSDKPEYPRGQVKNAFARRGYPVYVTRGKTICFAEGAPARQGWIAVTAESFDDKVET